MDASHRCIPRRSFLDRHADKFALSLLFVILIALVLCLCACAPVAEVGSRAVYDAGGATLTNPSPNTLNFTDSQGGTTTGASVGPIQQVYAEKEGNLRAVGVGVSNKGFMLALAGVQIIGASQDDANATIEELYGPDGKIVAKGVKFTSNVSDPTKATAELLKQWGPVYVAALEQARLGNKDKYDAVVKSIEAASPVVLSLLQAAFGIP